MKKNWDRKQTQVVWADLEAWQQQLYEDHGVRLDVEVVLPLAGDGVGPAVVMEAVRRGVGRKEEVVKRDYAFLDLTITGHAEKLVLQMASKLLLELENDKERAERQAAFPF
jgi:hypothetical protein